MTSARSRRQPLSGNNSLKALLLAVVFAAGCSPKTQPPAATHTESSRPAKSITKPVEKPQPKVIAEPARFSTIAMLLPLKLDNLNSAAGYKRSDQKQANMGLDYYQGFKLALDSLTAQGYNYRLQVFDSKDQPAEAHNLSLNPRIRNSDLVVGPFFPDGIKEFSATAAGKTHPMVSPLSPASPAIFHNPSLITVIPPLDYHAKRAAQYVNNVLRLKKVIILKSGYSEENKYAVPFKRELDSLSRMRVKVIQYTVTRGNLTPLLAQLSKTEQNIFIMPSTNQAFLAVTLRSLDTLAKHYPVMLVGHPSWEHLGFLKADLLQRLKTVITSADHVNYKESSTITFVRAYRKAYHLEPGEYAIKGFDEGMYFGKLLAESNGNAIKPEQEGFEGLHNNFHFVKKAGEGWINTHVNVLKYINFELRVIE